MSGSIPGQGAQKRKPLSEISSNQASKVLKLSDSASAPSKPAPKQNVGGSSKMLWYNHFLDDPALQPALQNLISKISKIEVQPNNCHHVTGFTETTRPQIDLKFRTKFEKLCPEGPARFSPYVISLLKSQVRISSDLPPAYPASLRKVKAKRSSSASAGNEKDATWVASHLCHNRLCVNQEHLRWEPSWMNRLRDNCPGGDGCVHRPDRCLAPHREVSELIDWTDYI